MTISRTLAIALLLLLVGPQTVSAQDSTLPQGVTKAQRDSVELLLSGCDYFPTQGDLLAVTPKVASVLIAMATDTTELPSTRLRAIDALGLFERDPQVATHFETTLFDGSADEVILRHSVTSSMKAFGDQALPWVQPYLAHREVQLRLTAIHAVGKFGGAEGRTLLQYHSRSETNHVALEQLSRFTR